MESLRTIERSDVQPSILGGTVELVADYESPTTLDVISVESVTLGQQGLYDDSGYPSGKHS